MTEDKPVHPGRTPAQRRVLDAIGCGTGHPAMSNATRDKLISECLIGHLGDEEIARDRFGSIKAPVYEMPISVHVAWCAAITATDEEMIDLWPEPWGGCTIAASPG